ncbi:MAG: hypothetical protein ACE5J9_00820 [Methanosarcinales archaeon]
MNNNDETSNETKNNKMSDEEKKERERKLRTFQIECVFCKKRSRKVYALKEMSPEETALKMGWKPVQIKLFNLRKDKVYEVLDAYACYKCVKRVFLGDTRNYESKNI